jgi:hypothetical protein
MASVRTWKPLDSTECTMKTGLSQPQTLAQVTMVIAMREALS